ncbi:glycosyltransferase family 39 protein [Foetidibacter luteolus]|uniref:glycosyltransferase family 39 protein n=1 Tax=Foetidibacter luteolus TaxID=2608880 RepID=UPI00129B1097|nr:glycosyltransferase family 39 protein [Foetidibacter luteolus]
MRNYKPLLYILAIIKLLAPFILQSSFYQPHRDEFLYLAEGRHMDWGYMEVPPLLSVFAWLTNLFGGSMFWIKIWPSLFGAFTFLLVGKIVLSLGGRAFALILAWLPFVIDGYMRLFYLFQPNFLEVFFWTAIGYCITRYIQTNRNLWIYITGIAIGLGLMSKYSVAFYTAAILGGLLISRHRKIFLNRHLYLAAGIALLIFLPNIIWQYNHRFPVLAHMDELQQEQLQFISPADFIISQFMMNLPCVFVWLAGLAFVVFSEKGKPYRPFGWAYLIVIVLLLVLHGKDYYALGAYPVLFAFGSVYIEESTLGSFRWTRYAMLAFSLALGLFALPVVLPLAKPERLAAYYEKTGLNKTGSFKWEDLQMHPLPQDFADMMGWKEMAMQAGVVYNSLPKPQRDSTLVYCRGYYSAGALNHYRREAGLPEVYSDNASFLFWMPDDYSRFRHLLLVAHNIPGKDDVVFQQFEKMTVKDTMNMPLFRETGMKFILFENGNDSLSNITRQGVAALKRRFIR